jgi:hypothetical protein
MPSDWHARRVTGPMDPRARLDKAMLIARITGRVVRGYELGQWGLSSHPIDEGNSLAADDADFMPELGPSLVSSTARFPAMGASEQLLAAGQVHAQAITDGKLRTRSVATFSAKDATGWVKLHRGCQLGSRMGRPQSTGA